MRVRGEQWEMGLTVIHKCRLDNPVERIQDGGHKSCLLGGIGELNHDNTCPQLKKGRQHPGLHLRRPFQCIQ